MVKSLLFEIISKLNEIGYNVVAIVSDMGSKNMGLWKDLDISIHKTSFLHPITGNNIYTFADVPHTLKLLRNHFLDK